MDKALFEQLTKSMKEAIAISKGEIKHSRVFTVEPPDVKAVREKTGRRFLGKTMFSLKVNQRLCIKKEGRFPY
jgi:hypothetical protein